MESMKLYYSDNSWPLDVFITTVIQHLQKCRVNFIDSDIQIVNGILDEFCQVVMQTEGCLLIDIDLFKIMQNIPVNEDRAHYFFKQCFTKLKAFYEEKAGLYSSDESDIESAVTNMLEDIAEDGYSIFLVIRNITFLCDVFPDQVDILKIRELNCSLLFSANIELSCVEQSVPSIGNSVLAQVTRSATIEGHDKCTEEYSKAYEELKAALSK